MVTIVGSSIGDGSAGGTRAAARTTREDEVMAVVVRDHDPLVRRVLRSVLGRHRDEDDLVQEVFLRLAIRLRQPDAFEVEPWLRRVSRNVAIDELRRRRPELVEPHTFDDRRGRADDPTIHAEGAALGALLGEVIAELPDRQRQALLARAAVADGRLDDAASVHAPSASARDSLVARARRQVRRQLVEQWPMAGLWPAGVVSGWRALAARRAGRGRGAGRPRAGGGGGWGSRRSGLRGHGVVSAVRRRRPTQVGTASGGHLGMVARVGLAGVAAAGLTVAGAVSIARPTTPPAAVGRSVPSGQAPMVGVARGPSRAGAGHQAIQGSSSRGGNGATSGPGRYTPTYGQGLQVASMATPLIGLGGDVAATVVGDAETLLAGPLAVADAGLHGAGAGAASALGATAGSGTAGSGTAGSGTAGSGTAGSGTVGEPDGAEGSGAIGASPGPGRSAATPSPAGEASPTSEASPAAAVPAGDALSPGTPVVFRLP
jgi:RNA polymerase sigma factor (sigma-70 family)